MEPHILKALKEQRAGKTFQVSWEEWERHCAERGIDPYENCEDGVDLGGGDSYSIVCHEDPPKKEDE